MGNFKLRNDVVQRYFHTYCVRFTQKSASVFWLRGAPRLLGVKSSSRFKGSWRHGFGKKGVYLSGGLFLVMYLYW